MRRWPLVMPTTATTTATNSTMSTINFSKPLADPGTFSATSCATSGGTGSCTVTLNSSATGVTHATLVDNWDVLGLRGTGSIDYTIDSVFVPEAYTHFAVTDTPKRGGRLYTIGIIGFAMNAVMTAIERRLVPWQESSKAT